MSFVQTNSLNITHIKIFTNTIGQKNIEFVGTYQNNKAHFRCKILTFDVNNDQDFFIAKVFLPFCNNEGNITISVNELVYNIDVELLPENIQNYKREISEQTGWIELNEGQNIPSEYEIPYSVWCTAIGMISVEL